MKGEDDGECKDQRGKSALVTASMGPLVKQRHIQGAVSRSDEKMIALIFFRAVEYRK